MIFLSEKIDALSKAIRERWSQRISQCKNDKERLEELKKFKDKLTDVVTDIHNNASKCSRHRKRRYRELVSNYRKQIDNFNSKKSLKENLELDASRIKIKNLSNKDNTLDRQEDKLEIDSRDKNKIDNVSRVIQHWSFGKKKSIWDYIESDKYPRELRKKTFYFMYFAICVINERGDDPAWKQTIDYINRVYSYLLYGYEKNKMEVLEEVFKLQTVINWLVYGEKWSKADGKLFIW